jgi:glycosyltransferase involved in cell wall biosynthesis
MMNICFFNTLKPWGGGEKFYFDYALGFQKKGHRVFIVCSKNSVLSQKATACGLPQFNVEVKVLSALNPLKVFKLVRFFKREKIDSVMFSTSQDLKLGGLSSKLAGVEKIIYRRGLAKTIKNRFINRMIFKNILTHIIANSEETKRTILQNLSKYVDADKIKVIYNGIHVGKRDVKVKPLEKINEKSRGIVLGNAGRLTIQKGQQYLLEVAKILKKRNIDYTLFIAGTGKLKDELNNKIKAYNLEDQVILLDFVEEMERFICSIDIFLFSSVWEGFGYVLAEAMIKSKPVVAFNITSNPEIINEGVTGFLVDYPDVKQFAEKVELLIRDEVLRKQIGENGKKSVYDRFVIEDRISELEAYLTGKQVSNNN